MARAGHGSPVSDDHPRNHALLRRHKGWRVSPAYDGNLPQYPQFP